jgi:hypothetical protein
LPAAEQRIHSYEIVPAPDVIAALDWRVAPTTGSPVISGGLTAGAAAADAAVASPTSIAIGTAAIRLNMVALLACISPSTEAMHTAADASLSFV